MSNLHRNLTIKIVELRLANQVDTLEWQNRDLAALVLPYSIILAGSFSETPGFLTHFI